MSYIKFVAGVIVPKSVIIACATINAANQLGLTVNMFVTSGNDRVHKRGSKHYTNDALDFRTKHLSTADKRALITAVKKRLGPDYDVILEAEGQSNEHAHIEFDPKN